MSPMMRTAREFRPALVRAGEGGYALSRLARKYALRVHPWIRPRPRHTKENAPETYGGIFLPRCSAQPHADCGTDALDLFPGPRRFTCARARRHREPL